jgi:hypothetical protein
VVKEHLLRKMTKSHLLLKQLQQQKEQQERVES